MVVQHNLTAMNSNRMLNITTSSQAKSTEKLSSGYKINRAADDAAGLSISEKMRKQIRGLTQASSNAQDGISMVQTADGALEEVHAMLQRCNELAVKAANGTISDDDRKYIAEEITQIHTEIDRVRTTSKFNETYLFPSSGSVASSGSANVSGVSGLSEGSFVAGISYNVKSGVMSITTSSANGTAEVTDPSGKTSSATILEERIANEFLPNAIAQILDTFPSLKTAEQIDMTLDIKPNAKSGPGGTLAYATISYTPSADENTPVTNKRFSFWVDVQDFDDDDALGTGNNAGTLEATIAHELMHTVMQNVFTSEMVDNDGDGTYGSDDFPKWFQEGMADIAGGGFEAGHNSNIRTAALAAGKTDPEKNALIVTELKKHDLKDENDVQGTYGEGYLACAYIGYLAGGKTIAGITNGIDRLFTAIKGGQTLDQAVTALTGKSLSAIENIVNDGTDDEFVTLVRNLAEAAGPTGAGSFASGSLSNGGTNILGNAAGQQLYRVAGTYSQTSSAYSEAVGAISLHVGADSGRDNKIEVKLFNIGIGALGLGDVSFASMDGATAAIDAYTDAITRVSSIRSYFGAIQNRLEHTIANLDNVVENTTSAESAIRDTDMATEMVRYSNNNILAQAGQAMLAQANQSNQGVLSLLQ